MLADKPIENTVIVFAKRLIEGKMAKKEDNEMSMKQMGEMMKSLLSSVSGVRELIDNLEDQLNNRISDLSDTVAD